MRRSADSMAVVVNSVDHLREAGPGRKDKSKNEEGERFNEDLRTK